MFWNILVTNVSGSDLHLSSMLLQQFFVAKLHPSSDKISNSLAGTFELSPQVGLKSRAPNEAKIEAKTRPENMEPLSFSNGLPPARQQVSSRSLEAAWQQINSNLHAAHGDVRQPFSSNSASAAFRSIDGLTLERLTPGTATYKHVTGFARGSHE
jgi:hypothetical protein